MFIGSNNNDEEDDSDDEEDYSPDCESGNEDSDEDDISGLVDDSSFVNNNSKGKEESTRVPDIINNMSSKVNNSNTSAVTEGFARMNVGDDDFCTDFRAPFIQYAYIENDQKYIDIDFLVMTFPKKMFRPEVKDGGKAFELGIVCPKMLSNKLRLTSTNDALTNNSNQVTSFKEVSDKLHVAHDWSKELLGRPQYVRLKFECEPRMVSWGIEEFNAGNQKLNTKLKNTQFLTILSVRLRSVERPRLEDKKGVVNIHTDTPSRLKIDTTASEAEDGDMDEDDDDL